MLHLRKLLIRQYVDGKSQPVGQHAGPLAILKLLLTLAGSCLAAIPQANDWELFKHMFPVGENDERDYVTALSRPGERVRRWHSRAQHANPSLAGFGLSVHWAWNQLCSPLPPHSSQLTPFLANTHPISPVQAG